MQKPAPIYGHPHFKKKQESKALRRTAAAMCIGQPFTAADRVDAEIFCENTGSPLSLISTSAQVIQTCKPRLSAPGQIRSILVRVLAHVMKIRLFMIKRVQ